MKDIVALILNGIEKLFEPHWTIILTWICVGIIVCGIYNWWIK